jgi:nucleoside-diphosphate-sugar epimerase
MHKKKVAVTGAAGQVGSVIVRHLAAVPDIEAVAICRNPISAGVVHALNAECDIRTGSITEMDSAQKMLGDCDIVINCALAMVSGRPKLSRELNKNMIDNIVRLDKLKMLVHLSSISVYGGCIDQKKMSSKSFEQPPADNDYGRSKLFIEKYAERMCRSRKLQYYLLRLGHVIGAKMDRSRQICEFASNPHFRLPYDGQLPSNTVHVERLAAMITALVFEPVPVGAYNVADENRTWRQVFDWHTETIGMNAVQGMPPERSECLKSFFTDASLLNDMKKWLGTVPFLSIVRYPVVFEYAYRALANTPQFITNRVAAQYKRLDIARQIRELGKNDDRKLGPVYVSDAMPGPHLAIPPKVMLTVPSQDELDNALRDWHARFALPRWLPDQLVRM